MTGQPIGPPPGPDAPEAADGTRAGGLDWAREEPPTEADLYGLCPDPFRGSAGRGGCVAGGPVRSGTRGAGR